MRIDQWHAQQMATNPDYAAAFKAIEPGTCSACGCDVGASRQATDRHNIACATNGERSYAAGLVNARGGR